MKLKSFLRALIRRINLISAPKSMVCFPLVQVRPSRNSGTGTSRDWEEEPRNGPEILGEKEKDSGNVGAWRVGKLAI